MEPRPSASVILVRDGPEGLETFMVRRHAQSPAFPSAYVFPGGTVRDDDRAVSHADSVDLGDLLSARSDTPVAREAASALYMCAIRELFEEAGVLLVHDANGDLLGVDETDISAQERFESLRLALQSRELSVGSVFRERGWTPAFDLLVPFSHWITPRMIVARFDTRFFVAELPPRQSALHDTIETSEGVWLPPARALDGDYHTVYATAQHLRRLAPFTSVADVFAFARHKPIRMVSPEIAESGTGLSVHIPPHLVENW